ncbi:uncharacterized protein K441DRAFT_561074, partial [Cenococcum geophilum 1.58]|uniref:uncharacterized protein n=1 Tax=Cenococcum geophilum 1.58 TaxID=794803 RepID=UPI00358E2832
LLKYLLYSPDAYFKEMLWFLYNKYNIIVARSTLLAGLKQRRWSRKVIRIIAQ